VKMEKQLVMGEMVERMLGSLRKTKDYAECAIKGPGGWSVHRILLDPYARVLYSTSAEEVSAIETLERGGLSVAQAVSEVVKRNYGIDYGVVP